MMVEDDVGAPDGTGSHASTEPKGLGPSGFDPSREALLVQKVILSISSASVPHPAPILGGMESRSLSYYLGVGIDHFNHDYARHETLLTKAAEQAIAMIRQHDARDSDTHPQGGDTERGSVHG